MRILSFETATYSGGVAFLAPGVCDCAGPFEPRSASTEILAAAHALLERHSCTAGEVDLLAVSTGPGLFTGVRVGLALAKALAWALSNERKIPLVGVSTLEAVAECSLREAESPQPGELVAAVNDARRGEVYAALFQVRDRPGGRSLARLTEDLVVRPERACERLFAGHAAQPLLGAPLWLVGDGARRYRDTLAAPANCNARTAPAFAENLAAAVGRLGLRHWEGGARPAPESLAPHYVRRPDARPSVLP